MSHKDQMAEWMKAHAKSEASTYCGTPVEVRPMTVGERSHVMDVGYTKGKVPSVIYKRFTPALLAATLYKPGTDEKMFGDDDWDFINKLDPAETDRVQEIALRLSGLDKEAPKEAGKDSEAASVG